MRFDLSDLRLFLAIVEAGSITHGASAAGLSLPSASARVAGMEARLGTPLLERRRRGVAPTPAGLSLNHHARAVLRQVEAMHAELTDFGRGLRGHIRLMAHTAALTEILPDRLGPFLVAHPGLDIHVEERESRLIVPAIADNEADLGIVSEAAAREAGLDRLEAVPFHEDRLVVVAAPTHPVARRRRVAFADLLDHTFVGLRAGSALQDHLAGQAARLGRSMVLRIRLNGFDALCRLAGQGVGLAVVPESAARRSRRAAGIAIVRLSDPWARRRLVICLRSREALPRPAQRLLAALTDPP